MSRPTRRTDGRKLGSARSLLDKRRAVEVWIMTADYSAAGRAIGAPDTLIRKWRLDSSWWSDLEADLLAELDAQHKKKASRAFGLALDNLVDRLENGDAVVTRDGQPMRVPVRTRDLVIAADRLNAILRLDSRDTRAERAGQSLETLAAEFSAIARAARDGSLSGPVGRGKTLPKAEAITPSQIVDAEPDVGQ